MTENAISPHTAGRGPGRPRKHPRTHGELMNIENMLAVPDVAQFFQVPESLVYQLVKQEALPATRIGKHLRFYRHELLKWIEGRRVKPPIL